MLFTVNTASQPARLKIQKTALEWEPPAMPGIDINILFSAEYSLLGIAGSIGVMISVGGDGQPVLKDGWWRWTASLGM